jgi:hypothetical protein
MEPGLSRSMYFKFWRRMSVFWWLMMPVSMFAPAWNAVHSRPDQHGEWLGDVLVLAVVVPLWLYMFKVGRVLWQLMDVWEAEDVAAARKRALEEQLELRRAERLQRAQERLALIHHNREAEQAAAITADLMDLREELDPDE